MLVEICGLAPADVVSELVRLQPGAFGFGTPMPSPSTTFAGGPALLNVTVIVPSSLVANR